jgi:hypothetical protein
MIYKTKKNKDGSRSLKLINGKKILKEDYVHLSCVQWFYVQYGDFRDNSSSPMLCHIANETPKSNNRIQMINYSRKMKRMGKISGIPDFLLRSMDGRVIFIEMKALDGVIDKSQKIIHDYLNQEQPQCFVCRTLEEFENIVRNFLRY